MYLPIESDRGAPSRCVLRFVLGQFSRTCAARSSTDEESVSASRHRRAAHQKRVARLKLNRDWADQTPPQGLWRGFVGLLGQKVLPFPEPDSHRTKPPKRRISTR